MKGQVVSITGGALRTVPLYPRRRASPGRRAPRFWPCLWFFHLPRVLFWPAYYRGMDARHPHWDRRFVCVRCKRDLA